MRVIDFYDRHPISEQRASVVALGSTPAGLRAAPD
jgi:hypothetical protein